MKSSDINIMGKAVLLLCLVAALWAVVGVWVIGPVAAVQGVLCYIFVWMCTLVLGGITTTPYEDSAINLVFAVGPFLAIVLSGLSLWVYTS